MCTPTEIQYIVFALNQAPFNKDLTLVSFDEKSPPELLQLLNDVFVEISTDHNIDLRDETIELTVERFISFLWVLKYKPNVQDPYIFKTGLTSGDKHIIHPILLWLLQRIPDLRKRAYLAKYLITMEVPTDMITDDVYIQYKERQDEFKEVHKIVDKIRSSGFEPDALKREVSKLEEEKAQLMERIDRIRRKVQELPNIEKFLEAARGLRLEMEMEDKLNQKLDEQKALLVQSKQRSQRVSSTLRELRNMGLGKMEEDQSAETNNNNNGEVFLQKLEDEVKTNTFLVKEKLAQEMKEKQEWAEKLKRVLNEPSLTDQARQQLLNELTILRRTIKDLTTARDQLVNPVDDKLNLFRQQANLVEKRKEEKDARLKDVLDDLEEVEKEHATKKSQLEAQGARVLRGEELETYVAGLRRKTQVYRKSKAELAELRTEGGILARTVEILQSRDSNLKEFLSELAAKKGVTGFDATVTKLEEVSQAKAETDEEKSKTLEEISKIVTEINSSIKERRNKLSPQVKELRQIRQLSQEMEVTYNEKKQAYESAKLSLDSDKTKLEQEWRLYQDECEREESRYHYLHSMNTIVDAQLVKAQEKDGKNTFKEIYAKRISEQEQNSKHLREKQKELKETHEPNLKQREAFIDLRKILRKKLEIYRTGIAERNNSVANNNDEMSAGVDRMVL